MHKEAKNAISKEDSGSDSVLSGVPFPGRLWCAEGYLELMEQCIPRKTEWNTISSIVMEEAGAFFAGDKSAHEVAAIIQSRVQLYLEM